MCLLHPYLVLTCVSHHCSLPGFYFLAVYDAEANTYFFRCTRGTPYTYTRREQESISDRDPILILLSIHQGASFGDFSPAPDYQQVTSAPIVGIYACVTAAANANAFVFSAGSVLTDGSFTPTCDILNTAGGSSVTSYTPRSFDLLFNLFIEGSTVYSNVYIKGSWYAVVWSTTDLGRPC